MHNSNKLFNKLIESNNLSLSNDVFSKKKEDSPEILSGDFIPQFYDDITISLFFKNTAHDTYCIGTIESNNYMRFNSKNLEFMETLLNITDGEKTIDDIERILSSLYTLTSYRQFFTMLGECGLIKNYKTNKKSDSNIFSIDLLSLDINTFCLAIKNIIPSILLLFKLAYLIVFSILLGLIIAGSININTIFHVDKSSTIETMIIFILYIIPTIITHELSHMIVAIKYNLIPSQMRFSLYLLMYPMIHVVIPGIYFIKRKERIWILSAGIIWNSFFMMLCIIMGNMFSVNTLKILSYSNLIVIIVNLIPFFLSDGYFILCNLMKTANLRRDFTLFILSFRNKSIDRKKIFTNKFSVFYIVMSFLFLIFGMYGMGIKAANWIYDFLNSRWSIQLNQKFFIPMAITLGAYIFILLIFSTTRNTKKNKRKKIY